MTDGDLTRDAFLGGLLYLHQPKSGYRAGVDPVLLAACVPARPGQSVLDLGCGVGAAALCLGARVPGLSLTGVERQPRYAALARRNGGPEFEVVVADVSDLPKDLRMRQFDHVIANPPYFESHRRKAAGVAGRETALSEDETPLTVWVTVAAKRLVPKGFMHLIHRAERLPDILCALPPGMGSVEVLPLTARQGRPAELVILRAKKNGRAAFRMHFPQVMHKGDRHTADEDTYVGVIRDVLRGGAALQF